MSYSNPNIWAVGFLPEHRLDKKCGNSAIPDNAVCRKGAGTRSKRGSASVVRQGLEYTAMGAGAATYAGGLLQAGNQFRKGNLAGTRQGINTASAGLALAGAGAYSRGMHTKNKQLRAAGARAVLSGAAVAGLNAYQSGAGANFAQNARQATQRARAAAERTAENAQTELNNLYQRVRSVGYRRRSGPPRHAGYLGQPEGQPFRRRGRGKRGPWSERGS